MNAASNSRSVLAWARLAAEAARKCHEWMQGNHSDTDFNQDGMLSEADACAYNAAYESEVTIAILAELLEADREYDEARAAVDDLRDGVSTLGDVVQAEGALRRAQERRAAALKCCGGAK